MSVFTARLAPRVNCEIFRHVLRIAILPVAAAFGLFFFTLGSCCGVREWFVLRRLAKTTTQKCQPTESLSSVAKSTFDAASGKMYW